MAVKKHVKGIYLNDGVPNVNALLTFYFESRDGVNRYFRMDKNRMLDIFHYCLDRKSKISRYKFNMINRAIQQLKSTDYA